MSFYIFHFHALLSFLFKISIPVSIRFSLLIYLFHFFVLCFTILVNQAGRSQHAHQHLRRGHSAERCLLPGIISFFSLISTFSFMSLSFLSVHFRSNPSPSAAERDLVPLCRVWGDVWPLLPGGEGENPPQNLPLVRKARPFFHKAELHKVQQIPTHYATGVYRNTYVHVYYK